MDVLRFPKNVVFREEPDGGLLFNVDTGDMRFVEALACSICRMIDGGCSRAGILSELAKRYPGQPAATLESDLDEFLGQLRESRMLVSG
jgi:hypothetical protein